MNLRRRLFPLPFLCLFPSIAWAQAQVTPADLTFLSLSARSALMPYEQSGKEAAPIRALLTEGQQNSTKDPLKSYRAYTKSIVLMSGKPWTPESELTTALDFSLNVKVVEAGSDLFGKVTFLFDGPPAEIGPYRIDLDLSRADGSPAKAIPGRIDLGEVQSRTGASKLDFALKTSALSPGLHTVRATLRNNAGADLFQYYRTFIVIKDLNRRLSDAQKKIERLSAGDSLVSTSARYLVETIAKARDTYLGGSFQNFLAFTHTGYRARNMAQTEVMDFETELARARSLLDAIAAGNDPVESAKGDMRLAYLSTFDRKLVPFRLYVPRRYDKSKTYPLVMTLHGAGGDENNFIDRYQGLWPKLAEERGYIVAAANGRGPLSGYTKESGAQQDVMDVITLVRRQYAIDPNRIYLAGHSMGAGGTWRLGLEYRDMFAALAPIAGTRMTPVLEKALSTGRKIPLIIVAGVKDALVPVAGCREVAEKTKALGYDVKYLEYPDGDHLSVAVSCIKDIFDFFDTHSK